MKKMLFLLLAVLAAALVLVQHHDLAGDIHGLAGGSSYSVSEVLTNPRPLIGSEITVSGVAGDSIALLGAGYFELRDNKAHGGKVLTILSNHGVPPAGEQATVQGTLRELYVAGSHEKLVLVESPQQPSKDTSHADPLRP